MLKISFVSLLALICWNSSSFAGSGEMMADGAFDGAAPNQEASPVCQRYLVSQSTVTSVNDRKDLVKAIQQFLSPTRAIADAANVGSDPVFMTNMLSTANWQALSEANFDRAVRVTPDLVNETGQLFQFVFSKLAGGVEIPLDQRTLAGFRDFAFGRRANVFQSLDSEEAFRRIWKARPDGDLREANPEFFAEVPNQAKYQQTFRALLERVMVRFEVEQRSWPRNWIQWTDAVNSFIERNFANSSQEQRLFIIEAIEQVFLRVPALPVENDLTGFLARLKPMTFVPSSNRPSGPRSVVFRERRATPRNVEVPVAAPAVPAPSKINYEFSPVGQSERAKLNAGLSKKLDAFLAILDNGSGGLGERLSSGGWYFEKMKMMGDDVYTVRLNGGYRVVFHWNKSENRIRITNVNRDSTHGSYRS